MKYIAPISKRFAWKLLKHAPALILFACPFLPAPAYGQTPSVKEYIYLDGKAIAVESSLNGYIPAPQLLYADVNPSGQVEVRWCIDSYVAANFEIERIPGGVTQVSGGQGCISWYDTNVSSGVAYAYRVRAKNAFGLAGPYSGRDIAAKIAFSNNPLGAGVDFVQAQHLMELRQAVASVRTCAGLNAPTWTDENLSGVQIKAIHLVELRNQLDSALQQLQVSLPEYTDGSITAGVTVVKASHVQEIREKLK